MIFIRSSKVGSIRQRYSRVTNQILDDSESVASGCFMSVNYRSKGGIARAYETLSGWVLCITFALVTYPATANGRTFCDPYDGCTPWPSWVFYAIGVGIVCVALFAFAEYLEEKCPPIHTAMLFVWEFAKVWIFVGPSGFLLFLVVFGEPESRAIGWLYALGPTAALFLIVFLIVLLRR